MTLTLGPIVRSIFMDEPTSLYYKVIEHKMQSIGITSATYFPQFSERGQALPRSVSEDGALFKIPPAGQ